MDVIMEWVRLGVTLDAKQLQRSYIHSMDHCAKIPAMTIGYPYVQSLRACFLSSNLQVGVAVAFSNRPSYLSGKGSDLPHLMQHCSPHLMETRILIE